MRNDPPRPRILDGCCGAGGAAAGFKRTLPHATIIGVDVKPQPHYPYTFVQQDIIEHIRLHGHEYDYIHVSPPCQRNSRLTRGLWKDRIEQHVDLITPLRPLLQALGIPYDIENVPGAPLINPVTLCGSMFGLQVRRHRHFECSFPVKPPPLPAQSAGPCRASQRALRRIEPARWDKNGRRSRMAQSDGHRMDEP